MAFSESAGRRVVVAGLFHETNTFLEGLTPLQDFEALPGPEMLRAHGTGSPLAGVLDEARTFRWETIPAIDMRAMPGPLVEDAVAERFLDCLETAILDARACGIDGVLLVLHGAMVCESIPDVEGFMLRAVRRLVGPRVPVCGVLDLHANFSASMAQYADALVAYQTNPHTDAEETAVRTARLLDRLMRTGESPRTVWEQTPLMWPPTGTGTEAEPMRTLEAMARQMEQADSNILAVNVLAGFAFADIRDAGVAFTAVTVGDPASAREGLRKLGEWAWQHRDEGNVADRPLEEAIAQLPEAGGRPVLLVEPSDNIGAGSSGRGVTILRTLIERGVANSAVVINAPEAVAALAPIAPGDCAHIVLGGAHDVPLELDVELASSSDGRFTLEDRQSHLASIHGCHIEMGPCATVRHGGVTILLTSRKTPPFDLGQFRSQGIEPEKLSVIGVKAAVAHRRAYDPIAGASFSVDTPGPCTSNLRSLPYQEVRRPIFPLDL